MLTKARIEELWEKRRMLVDDKGSQKKQHAVGKLTARERIELLVDPGS